MIASTFHTIVYLPLYNGLIFLVDIVPWHDVGIAVILLTLVVKVILFPLSLRVAKTQEKQKKLAPQIEELKKKHKGNRQAEAQALMALYKQNEIHPLSGILLILVQFPILIGLYFVFANGGLPQIDSNFLYGFIPTPNTVTMEFLGLVDMAGKYSIPLAALAGLTQFIYAQIATPPMPKAEAGSFQADMARSFNLQIRYVLPLIVAGISYTLVAAVPLYWLTSNIFMIGQEYLVRARVRSA